MFEIRKFRTYNYCLFVEEGGCQLKDILMILMCVALGSIGQLSIKLCVQQIGKIATDWASIVTVISKGLTTPLVLLGLGLYGASSLIWVVILSRVKLSFALPMMSSTYVFVVFLAWFVLKEDVPWVRLIGVFVICAGVFLVSRGR